jgi:hypothetical protein
LELVPRVITVEMELISCPVFLKIKLIPISVGLKLIAGFVTLELPSCDYWVLAEWASFSLIVVKGLTETFIVKLLRICT